MNKVKSGLGFGVAFTALLGVVAFYLAGQPAPVPAPRTGDEVTLVAEASWDPSPASPSAAWSVWVNQRLIYEKSYLRKPPEPYTFTAPRGSLVQVIVVSAKAKRLRCSITAVGAAAALKRTDVFDLPEVVCQHTVA